MAKKKRGRPRGSWGGLRDGAGGKMKMETILKRLAIKDAEGEAEKSMQFLVNFRDNPQVPPNVRLAAATVLMDRVWGKPNQSIEHRGGSRLVIIRPTDPLPEVKPTLEDAAS